MEEIVSLIAVDNYHVLLKLAPPYFMRRYGVRQVFGTAGLDTVIKYEMEITYKKTIPEGFRVFELNRFSDVYINDEVPDKIADELAARTGQVFYPLQILADFEGNYVSVYNLSDIQQRWKGVKENLLEFFVGDEALRYLQYTEAVIFDQDVVNDVFRKDLIIRAYFAGLYKSYQNDHGITGDLFFPLIGHAAPLSFSVKQQLAPFYNRSGQLEITHEGLSNDERGIADIMREDDFATSRDDNELIAQLEAAYKARYALSAHTKSIEAMEVSWTIALDKEETTTISMYEISGMDKVSGKQQSLIADEEKEGSKSGIAKFIKSIFG